MTRLARKKLLLLGEIGVGKTSLVRRLTLGALPTDYRPTLGVSLYTYVLPIPAVAGGGEQRIEFAIWDTDGNIGPAIFQHDYSVGTHGALIVGDVARRATLDLMVDLAEAFQDALPSRHFTFVANKADLATSRDEAPFPDRIREGRHRPLWTSALTGEGVEPAFVAAGRDILRRGL